MLTASGSATTSNLLSSIKVAFEADEPGYTLNVLAGTGTGGGVQGAIQGTLDVAAMGRRPKDDEADQIAFVSLGWGAEIPIAHAGVGVPSLTTQDLIAIFAGEITFWDDEAIKTSNPELALPNEPITVVHRADGFGTTWIFTNFLDKVSESWHEKAGFGKVVPWPVGVGAKGNPGVAAYVQRVNGSIGYVEFAFAKQNNLSHATLKNLSGEWVQPTIESFQEAAANADWVNSDHYYLVLTNQPGDGSWPIAGATFILIHKEQADAAKAQAMFEFLDWCYDHGDEMAIDKDYVPVPDNVVGMVRATWGLDVTSGGKSLYK